MPLTASGGTLHGQGIRARTEIWNTAKLKQYLL